MCCYSVASQNQVQNGDLCNTMKQNNVCMLSTKEFMASKGLPSGWTEWSEECLL